MVEKKQEVSAAKTGGEIQKAMPVRAMSPFEDGVLELTVSKVEKTKRHSIKLD